MKRFALELIALALALAAWASLCVAALSDASTPPAVAEQCSTDSDCGCTTDCLE
jgi:hypothetical protein